MRILLTSNASYAPPRGGSTRSNLVWLRDLAAKGHTVQVVCPWEARDNPSAAEEWVQQDGIAILRVRDFARNTKRLAQAIAEFAPDHVLVSSEDLSHLLLQQAGQVALDRLVYVAHTPQFFPFGPESWSPDAHTADIVRKARGVVVIGTHMASYVRNALGRDAAVIHPPIYGQPPYRQLGRFENPLLLMINPCRVKGLDLFLAMAEALPHLRFAGLSGWGTTTQDRQRMRALPNVAVLETVPDIEDVLAQARLLLMPSIWYEGFGLITMEAMLRGIPVIASDSGGLVEAKQGSGFIVPVQPVTKYEMRFDEANMPLPVTAAQDLAPWLAAIEALTTNQTLWQQEAERSRQAALAFVARLDAGQMEQYLQSLPAAPSPKPQRAVDKLSPAEKLLLLEKLKQRKRERPDA